jgi:hypothetical protein
MGRDWDASRWSRQFQRASAERHTGKLHALRSQVFETTVRIGGSSGVSEPVPQVR